MEKSVDEYFEILTCTDEFEYSDYSKGSDDCGCCGETGVCADEYDYYADIGGTYDYIFVRRRNLPRKSKMFQ